MNHGRGHAHGARDGDARRRRAERDWPRDFQALGVLRTEELRRCTDSMAPSSTSPARRFRLLIQHRRDDREMGPRRDYRRLRAADPHDPPGCRSSDSSAAATGGGQHHQASDPADARSVSRGRAIRPEYPEQIAKGCVRGRRSASSAPKGFAGHQRAAARSAARRRRRHSIRCSDGPTPSSVSKRAACTSARARRSCCCFPDRDRLAPIGSKDSVIGSPASHRRTCSRESTRRSPASRSYAGDTAAGCARVRAVRRLHRTLRRRRVKSSLDGPGAGAAPLAAGLAAVRDLRARLGALGLCGLARYEIDSRLDQKESQFEEALLLTHGIRLEALADDGTVVAGQHVKVTLTVGNNGAADVELKGSTCTDSMGRRWTSRPG